MTCLSIMKRDYGENCSSWPSKSSAINAFIKRQPNSGNFLADWIRRAKQNGDFNDKPGKVRKRLMKELVRLKAAQIAKGKITWHPRNINRLLAADSDAGSESLSQGHANEEAQQRGTSGQRMQEIAGVCFH